MSGPRSFLPLTGSHRFSAVFDAGTRIRRGGVTIIAATGQPGPARVGLVAGRRVGGAVARNRAKRRLRAVLDQRAPMAGLDIVVIASPSVVTVAFTTVSGWVRDALDEALGQVEPGLAANRHHGEE